MSSNKSILEFFKPRQPLNPGTSSQSAQRKPPSSARSGNLPKKNVNNTRMSSPSHHVAQSPILGLYSSNSLSPPPSSETSESYYTPPEENSPITGNSETPQVPHHEKTQLSSSPFHEIPSPQGVHQSPTLARLSRDRIIQNSDDEDGDSDDSDFQDLSTLFGTKSSAIGPAPARSFLTPKKSTPRSFFNFPSSPLTVQSKPKYDLKTLVRQREDEEALEISSKRIKAMLRPQAGDRDVNLSSSKEAPNQGILDHEALLGAVVADGADGETSKVKRALNRTEAAMPEMHWLFFDPQMTASEPPQRPFPVTSLPDNWKKELADPEMRYHTFISGFAEDMVSIGKALPDELFLWILDEVCWEEREQLRKSYVNVLYQSTKQINRLLSPSLIQKLFRSLGGTSIATVITEKIHPLPRFSPPDLHRGWPNLLTALDFLAKAADAVHQESRTFILNLILRMSVDRTVLANVDLFQAVQEAITSLCLKTPDDEWEQACQEICKTLFSSIDLPTLRYQLLESVSSATPRSHDLRRRLAMCFFFDDVSYSGQHSHALVDLDDFISRLEEPVFEVTLETDYRQLSALISILDIAVDDGRSTSLNYKDKAVEEKFNRNVDELSDTVKDIMRFIGNPGASFLSKLDAKRNLELVEKRISENIRSQAKPKHSWFDGSSGRKEEDLYAEKQGIKSFMSKMKNISTGSK